MYPASWLANGASLFGNQREPFPNSNGGIIEPCKHRGWGRMFGNLHILPNGYRQANTCAVRLLHVI
jgi:hypothetical protein